MQSLIIKLFFCIFEAKQKIQCPRPVPNVNGKYYSVETINESEHVVRLLEFIPGKLFHEIPITNYLLFQSGEYLAKLNKALRVSLSTLPHMRFEPMTIDLLPEYI